jgi:hypothetical protein
MAKVNGREDALLNAYLNRYQTAQASNVSTGRSTTRKAQQQGSAIMNATDKTLPVLHNSYTETLNNIVQGASLENSLNNDVLNRQMKLAQAKFDAANDLYQQQQKAQQYAAKKAAKAAKSRGKSSGKGGSTTGTGSDTESAASLDSLFGGTASTGGNAAGSADTARNKGGNYDPKRTNAERNASARARYDGSEQEKSDIKYRAQQKRGQLAQMLKDKQAAANAGANKGKPGGNSYAERQSAAQPAQSRAVTRGGKVIGSSYAAAGSAPSAAETQAAKDKRNDYKSQQEDIAAALKKLQSDAGYRAELAAPGRKLTSAEVAAVNQYEKSTKNTGFSGLKRGFETAANKEGLSQEDYAKKTATMNAELNQNSALRGKAQMNGAGQTAQAFTAGLYDSVPFLTKSVDKLTDIANETGAELPQLSNAIEGAKSYDPLAAAAGTLVGKGMQYDLFNTAMAGTPLAQTMGKAGNAVVGQAQKIPVLGDVLGAGAGDALGRILTDTTADLALDTLPSLVNDVSEGKSAGEIAGNTAKNIAGNVAMNALPEIGGALFNRLKGTAGDAAQDALKQADNAVQDVQRQQEIGDEAKLALQNTDSLPIDAQRAAGYNEVNGGVQNDNLGTGVRADVSLNADTGAGYEPQPGGVRSGLAGQTGTAGLGSTADGNGRGVQGPDAPDAGTVAEWAKSITGKDRRSVYTRRIEDLYGQLQSGATRESMADEAKDIALGIVKDSDFAEPVDEATAALRDYFKSTPIRLDEQAAGDILYTSGLKNIQQYNFQNGTNFSTTSGLPYDTALMELADMGTGVSGSSVDDLLSAVAASNRGALVDTDQAAATADYYRDMILDGPTGRQTGTEDFSDWLEVQGFDSNMPDYTRRVYDRMFGGTDTADAAAPLQDSRAQSVAARPLNGSESVPAHAVGAESTQYDRREVLNQDYANQRAMGGKIDADEAAAAGIGQQTHTVYSRAEGKDTAKQDFDLLVQQNGDILSAGRTVADELTRKSADGNFDASDVYRGYYAADQLQNMLNSYEKGSADAQLVQAQIENLNRAVSAGQSKNAQALSAGRWAQIDEYTPIRKFEQITQRKVNDFAETRDGKQLESLASDVVEMAKSGPQDEEFTAFLKAQGVDVGDNPLNAQMNDLAMRIKRMADTKGIKTTDEQAKSAAASILSGGNADDVFNAMARKSLGIENLSQEDYDYVKNAFAEMADMPDSKARYEKELDAYKRLTKYMPAKTFGDKMESIRYLSMLGNTRTHARNVLGNVSMGVVTRAKDNVSGVMQLALPKDQRTKAVGTTLTADGRKMVDLAKEYGQNKMYSVLYNDGKFNAESGLRAAQDTFTSKPGKIIQKAADINSALLEKEDNIFLTSAFGNAMASQLKARGYDSSVFTATDAKSKQALVDAAATALRDAKEATFHEDNFLSTALKNYQNDIKGHGVGGKILWAVSEGVLPFKKTPLNIAKNAMEYNIVGGTVEAAYRYAAGASKADVIDAAAKGLTGTALMGIGGILAYNGLLNGSKSGDDRADAFNEMTGKQEYSINIPGKGTYTIDWASPASVPLLMGAEIANEWQNGGLSVTKFLDSARKIGNPILDTTMLQGLNDTLNSVSYADSDDKLGTLITGTLGSYAQQYVPTALGQIARTIDPLRRSTYGGGDTKTERDIGYNIRKMENKIPGLSMNNEPYIDQWGREEASLDGTDDTAGGMFLRGAYNMLSPGYVSAENITPVDKYLQELYGNTNDSHVYPEKASSQIKVDGEGYYMTPEEKTEYAKTSGQTAYDLIDELRQNSMFLQLPEDQQSALVQDAYTVAKTAGGVAAVGDGVSGVNAKEYEAYRDGGAEGFSQYVLMKNATDLVRDEKRETSGNDNADLNTVEKWNTLYSQFGDDAVSNFVDSTDDDSTVHKISNLAGDKAVTAYMQAYSAVAKTLDDDQTPDKFTVGYGMQKYGLSGDDFARAYLAAYYKKDKNGKCPEKGGTYADKAGAEIYQSYGADALRDWVNYRATIPDTNGNGKADKAEAVARLKEMDLTNEMRRAYLAKTNKQWGKKNPF